MGQIQVIKEFLDALLLNLKSRQNGNHKSVFVDESSGRKTFLKVIKETCFCLIIWVINDISEQR